MGIWQKRLSKMVEQRNESQPKPGLRPHGTPCSYMLLERCRSKIRDRSRKQHKQSYNFRCKIQSDHPVHQTDNKTESLTNEVEGLRREKGEMYAALTQKHQESLNYYAEIERLNGVLEETKSKVRWTFYSTRVRLFDLSQVN